MEGQYSHSVPAVVSAVMEVRHSSGRYPGTTASLQCTAAASKWQVGSAGVTTQHLWCAFSFLRVVQRGFGIPVSTVYAA